MSVRARDQRDRVRLRCHGQSCLYYQRMREKTAPLVASTSRKRNVASLSSERALRRLCDGYRSARVGQPVISELTLFSLARSVSGRCAGRRQRRRGRASKAKFRSSTTTSAPRANFTLRAIARSPVRSLVA